MFLSCPRAAGGALVAIFAGAWLLMGSAWGAGLMTAVIASLLVTPLCLRR